MEIIPAILTSKVTDVRSILEEIRRAGKFKRVQIDFVDYGYNDCLSITPDEVNLKPYPDMDFDAHLMVTETNVGTYFKQAQKSGFDRIIAQAESISNPENFSGLALDIHSPIAAIKKYLEKLNVVIVMAVEPGLGGQIFDDRVFEKVRELSEIRRLNKFRYKICVDGGVEKEELRHLEKLGADEVAVGVRRVLKWNL
jgi:ribulose-phosphate 3-epimerase